MRKCFSLRFWLSLIAQGPICFVEGLSHELCSNIGVCETSGFADCNLDRAECLKHSCFKIASGEVNPHLLGDGRMREGLGEGNAPRIALEAISSKKVLGPPAQKHEAIVSVHSGLSDEQALDL